MSLIPSVDVAGRARRRVSFQSVARLAAGLLVAGALGCGPPWTVVRQTGPASVYSTHQRVGIRFDWENLRLGGKTEQEWLATQPAGDQRDYVEMRESVIDHLMSGLRREFYRIGIDAVPAEGNESFQLLVRPRRMQMGFYAVFVSEASELQASYTFQIGGQDVDRIDLTETAAPAVSFRARERMEHCADDAARHVVQYFQERTGRR